MNTHLAISIIRCNKVFFDFMCFVFLAHMLRMYRKDQPKAVMAYKKEQKDRQDPVKSHRPDLPITSGKCDE